MTSKCKFKSYIIIYQWKEEENAILYPNIFQIKIKQTSKQTSKQKGDTDNDDLYNVCKTIDKTHATTKPNLKWQTH